VRRIEEWAGKEERSLTWSLLDEICFPPYRVRMVFLPMYCGTLQCHIVDAMPWQSKSKARLRFEDIVKFMMVASKISRCGRVSLHWR